MIAIGLPLLASQGAVWFEIGKLGGDIDRLSAKVGQLGAQIGNNSRPETR